MFLDVRGLSDDHTAHPRYTVRFDEPEGTMLRLPDNHPDCRHFCQNCGIYRAWNSLLASLLLGHTGSHMLWSPTGEGAAHGRTALSLGR